MTLRYLHITLLTQSHLLYLQSKRNLQINDSNELTLQTLFTVY